MSSGKLVNDENLVFTWKPEPSGLSSSEVVFRANIDAHASKPVSYTHLSARIECADLGDTRAARARPS